MAWSIIGLALSVLAFAVTLFLEWPRLVGRFRETKSVWFQTLELTLIATSLSLVGFVAWHFVSLGGLQNIVLVAGWTILMLICSTLLGTGIAVGDGFPRSRPLPSIVAGLTMLLVPPAVGIANLLLSPSAFFPHTGYVLASLSPLLPLLYAMVAGPIKPASAQNTP